MRGDIVRDDGEVYEVIFDGAHHGQDLDLFRKVEEPEPAKKTTSTRPTREDAIEELVNCFAQKAVWGTVELREATTLTPTEFERALNTLRRAGSIASLERGVVAVVEEPEAA